MKHFIRFLVSFLALVGGAILLDLTSMIMLGVVLIITGCGGLITSLVMLLYEE